MSLGAPLHCDTFSDFHGLYDLNSFKVFLVIRTTDQVLCRMSPQFNLPDVSTYLYMYILILIVFIRVVDLQCFVSFCCI